MEGLGSVSFRRRRFSLLYPQGFFKLHRKDEGDNRIWRLTPLPRVRPETNTNDGRL